MMKLPVGEIDIATTAVPDEVVRRAKAASIKSVPTGIDHGTVTLVVDSKPFEVTTLREDTETFGRHARVSFGRDWIGDANRRDFTINALSVGPDGVVHDYVGGLADIAARRVRFIGEAGKRIEEDYLRILRFFRMHAAFGAGEVDRAGYLACIGGRAGLATLSAERMRMEMLKLLVAGRRGRRDRRDGRQRLAANDRRRRHLCRNVRGDDRGRGRAWPEGRCDAPARRAGGRRHRGRKEDRGPAAALQCRSQGARLHGPSLVAACRHGRGARQAAAVSAGRSGLSRPPAARLGAHGRRQRALDPAGAAAGALDRAEISAASRRISSRAASPKGPRSAMC